MNDPGTTWPGIAMAFVAGTAAGAFFFTVLKITIDRLASTQRPYLLLGASFFLRASVVVAVILWIGDGRLPRYVAALTGFVLARATLLRLWGHAPERPEETPKP
jgi:F1F0 ATPase subunit 2